MPIHIHEDHDLHDMTSIPEPTVDGDYYLHVAKSGTTYTYKYRPLAIGGGYANGTGTNVTCTTQNTFYKAVITFTAWSSSVDFSWDDTNKRFVYDGDGGAFKLILDITAESDTNNVDYTFKVYLNGAAVTGIDALRNIDANKSGRIGLNGPLTLAKNDYIEMYVASNSIAAPVVTFKNVQLTIGV